MLDACLCGSSGATACSSVADLNQESGAAALMALEWRVRALVATVVGRRKGRSGVTVFRYIVLPGCSSDFYKIDLQSAAILHVPLNLGF
jgi:hypothetical protein